MNMDVCAKKESQFSGFTGILLPRGNEIHYIGGAEGCLHLLARKKRHRNYKS